MAMQWFRFYHEWDSDPKVQMMGEAMQRRLAMLFCERCKGVAVTERHRAFHWRISEADLAETKALFIENGFIDESWSVLKWDKRQYLSDSSTERTRRYRERTKTSQERHRDASVTVPDTETESEQNQKKADMCAAASAALEPGKAQPPALDQHRRPVALPLINGTEWLVPAALCLGWADAYPAVNVLNELLKMRAWLDANPKNRKTASGIRRFVVNWLAREQNSARPEREKNNGYINRGQQRTNSNLNNAILAAERMAAKAIDGLG